MQEENEQLREALSVVVQAVDEDATTTLKYRMLASYSRRKVKEASVDHVATISKDLAAKVRQKFWGLENKQKKAECQLKTMAIDAKTREQVRLSKYLS